MTDQKDFAFRKTYTSNYVIIVDGGIIKGSSIDDALKNIISRSSVGSLREEMRIEIVPVDFDSACLWTAKYDSEPLTESHSATSAKLITRLVRT